MQADKILTGWLLLIGVHILFFYFFYSGVSYSHPFLLAIDMPMPLLHGPFLFLYTASLTNQFDVNKKGWLLHFLPAFACWLYLIRFFILPADQKIYIFQHQGKGFETFMLVNLVAIVLSGITYVVWSLILLRRHRKVILNQFSDTEKINLRWLQFLIYGIAFIWILVLETDEILYEGVVLFVVLLGYFGLKQPGIFTSRPVAAQLPQPTVLSESLPVDLRVIEPPPIPVMADERTEKRKYLKSGLTIEAAADLHQRLKKLMETEKIYTESELSLSELANRLNTLPNYLSQVINDNERKTFYDYINMLRIEEFKALVSRPENKKYTLLSLSFDCGFNSKSSFNKNFKKVTGQSPSEYLNSQNLETAA